MTKQEAQNLIKDLIEKTNVSVKTIEFSPDDTKTFWVSVEVDNPHFFTAREGEALSALNHLARKMIETELIASGKIESTDIHKKILIDINGFQKRKVESLHAVAHMMAERARYFKSSVEVDPMSAFERRIIHEFLADATDLKTESMGEGPTRRVVIKYTGGI